MSPKGISTPQDLLNYFKQIQGKGIVSGEFVETGDPASVTTDPLSELQADTGQYPGITGIDYWHFNTGGPALTTDADAAAIATWQAGGLVELSLSMPNPTTGGGCQDLSNLDVAGLLTPGTATNDALNNTLAQVGAGLQALQKAGVVVIFRPYHESDGNWYWWGAGELSASEFQSLWQYTYNYMTNTMGLHNLVWEYAINTGTTLPGRTLTDTYPGSAYVDITAQDLYTDNPGPVGQSTYQALEALGKPTALGEFGSSGPSGGDTSFSMPTLISQVKQYMPNTLFWLQWWAQNAGNTGWGMEEDQNTSAALNDGYVINRGQIDAASTATPTQPASANDTVVTNTSAAITDANGNQWTITSGGQVAVNGTADTTTGNVIELAYVNGTVWQENADNMWWGKTSPSAAWSPGSGTTTSPLPVKQTASANDTVVTNTSAAITDASGNRWTITSGGQVAVNGTADTTTGNVIELAYVNGTVWQENAGNMWWGKTSPSAAWSPGSGTTTSPLPVTSASLGSQANPLVIMPLGDSITEGGGTAVNGGPPPGGYRAPLYTGLTSAGYAIQYVGDQTTNPGGGLPTSEDHHEGLGGYSIETVDGDTTNPGLLNYIQNNNILQTYKPNVILLQIGYNNMYAAAPEGVGPATAFTYLEQMVQYIFQTLPNVKLIVSTLPATTGDSGTPTSDPNSASEIGYYNYLILHDLKSAINNPNLSIVDMNGAENSYTGSGGTASLIGPDGIHPNVAGCQVIANTWQAGIEQQFPLTGTTSSTGTPAPSVSANDTVVTGTAGAITDGSDNTWTINSAGQVAVNGVADTSTADVVELAYVNGTVWQENANDMWWGKTSPTASWSPGTGTTTSPLSASVIIAPDAGTETISQSDISVGATSGTHAVFISGSGDTVNLSGGSDTITDTGTNNTYVLPVAGQGSNAFSSDILAIGDQLDLTACLAATTWNGQASTLANYVSVADTPQGATVLISAKSGGSGVAVATLNGATGLTLTNLLAHAIT